MAIYRIGEVSSLLRLSVDTLRYYERIGLLPGISRSESGIRQYHEDDVANLRFIKQAQLMNFSLSEIGALLEFRKNPKRSKRRVRDLAQRKLDEIDGRLKSLKSLRRELARLVSSCPSHADGCAILSGIERRP